MIFLLMMRMNPGFTTASKVPSRKRLVATPAKFVHAGVVMRMTPQTIYLLAIVIYYLYSPPCANMCRVYSHTNVQWY